METKLTAFELAQLAAPLLASLKVANAADTVQSANAYRNFASLSDEAVAGAHSLYCAAEAYLDPSPKPPAERVGQPKLIPM